MIERRGEIVARVIADRREITVAREIVSVVNEDARIATDETKAFGNLSEYGYLRL